MGFFKANGDRDSRARRRQRLRFSFLKKTAALTLAASLVIGGAVAGLKALSIKEKIARGMDSALLASANAGFRVKEILVTGRYEVPPEEILERLNIRRDAPIFGIDLEAMQKSLSEIVRVRHASVSRRLPDTLVVDIEERIPAALWQNQKKLSLIDREGVVLSSSNLTPYRALPLIVGASAGAGVAEMLILLEAEPALGGNLAAATRIGGRRWDLRLKNGITVRLPETDAELALRRLMAAQEQSSLFERNIASIDLRQPGKMVIMPLTSSKEKI